VKKRNKLAGVASLYGSNIKSVDVDPEPEKETLATFTAKYNAEQEAKRLAPIRAAEEQMNQTMRALRNEKRIAILIVPSEDLSEMCAKFSEEGTPNATALLAQVKYAFNQFTEQLKTEGITFTPAVNSKLEKVCKLNSDLDWTSSTVIRQVFDYCDSLGLWTESEVIRPKAPAAPHQQKSFGLEDIESLDTTTSEGRSAAESLVNEFFYSREVGPIWQSWLDFMKREYHFVPNEAQSRKIIDWFTRNRGKSFLNLKHWDECRVSLREVLGNSPRTGLPMLTRAEQLSIDIQSVDMDNPDVRREFTRRTKDIIDTPESEYRQQQDAAAQTQRVDEVERRAAVLAAAQNVDNILGDMLVADAIKVRRRVTQSTHYTQAEKQGLDGGEAYRAERAAYYNENYN
jgi:hypothetical protein